MNKKKIIVITGPTASGKSALGFHLAKKLNTQIISADSRLIYRDFEIAAAKPHKDMMNEVIHHLVNFVDPNYQYTAGDFVFHARNLIENIHNKEISLARRFLAGITDIPDLKIYGDMDAPLRTPIISLNIGNMSSASVSDILWEDYEICVRAGAHCAPLMHKTFGTEKQGAVRFSFSCFNTEAEIDTAIRAMHEIAE